jgi:hypothetical protein
MDAGKVAGLLVLLGVVGVLAAIVGSGLEAGPVRFPSIPGSRQLALAIASGFVIVGGVTWWVIQQNDAPGGTQTAASSPAAGGLRVVLLAASSEVRLGDRIAVSGQVFDAGGQLGAGQCVLTWRDRVGGTTVRVGTTTCDATFTEPSASRVGAHRITATAEGTSGATGSGSRTVLIDVRG